MLSDSVDDEWWWVVSAIRRGSTKGYLACISLVRIIGTILWRRHFCTKKQVSNKLLMYHFSNIFWNFEPLRGGSDPRLGWPSGFASSVSSPAWQAGSSGDWLRCSSATAPRPLAQLYGRVSSSLPLEESASAILPSQATACPQPRPGMYENAIASEAVLCSSSHSSAAPVLTPSPSQGRAPLSPPLSVRLPPHSHPHLPPHSRPCERN